MKSEVKDKKSEKTPFMFLSDEGPTLKMLDFTFHIGSTPTFLYFELYLNTAYATHTYVHFYLYFLTKNSVLQPTPFSELELALVCFSTSWANESPIGIHLVHLFLLMLEV